MKSKPQSWRSRGENIQKPLPKAFVRHIRQHNRTVWTAVFLSALGAVVLWSILYFLALWLTLLMLTLVQGVDAVIPERFTKMFVKISLLCGPPVLLTDHVLQRFFPSFNARHPALKWCVEILAVPYKVPLGVWTNAQAYLSPSHRVMCEAVALLRMIDDMDYLEVRRLEVELPHRRRRTAVLQLLGMIGLIRYQMRDGRMYLLMQNPDLARRLIYSKVRLAKKSRTKSSRAHQKSLPVPSLDRFRNNSHFR